MSALPLRFSTLLLLCACLLVTGCKEVLYSDLTEGDANEMATVLAAAGIKASRSRDKDGVYELLTGSENVAAAITILRSRGLPRKKFVTMNEVFAAEGLVGSPFEERVRYIFALEEKLTENMVSIQGIRDARVTVSIPERPRYGGTVEPSSASVILHHEEDFVVEDAIAKIKTLVASAVQGLEYDNVAVVVFPTGGTAVSAQPHNSFPIAAADASTIATSSPLVINPPADLGRLLQYAFAALFGLIFAIFTFRGVCRRLGFRWFA